MSRLFAIVSLALALAAPSASRALAGAGALDRPVEARFEGRVAVGRAYQLLGGLAGIRFIFDEGVRLDELMELDVTGLTMRQVLEVLDLELGLWRVPVSEGVVLVAPDNTTKRREYEIQAVRTFYLQHANVKGVNALLRGIVDIRKTAVNEAARSITIRDSEVKVALAAELIARNDVARAQVDFAVEIWLVGPERAKELRGRKGSAPVLTAGRVDELRRRPGVEVLASPHLGAADGDRALLEIDDPPQLSFAIELVPRAHADERALTLDLRARLAVGVADGSTTKAVRRIESSVRVATGETVVLAGLMEVGADDLKRRGILSEDERGSRHRELVILVTPRVERWPAIPDEFERALPIGSGHRLSLPGR